jgi:hypothetical protein
VPTSQQKIITKLRERRQIEADLRAMASSSAEGQFRQKAQQIASLGVPVIPAIISNLDGADEQMLMAMGTVATYLDRRDVVQALRQAVRQPQRTDQGRITAMTILGRFLDEPPDPELLESLADPEYAATSSLEQVLNQAASDPSILIDYVQGLDQQEPDVVLALIRSLRRRRDPLAVEPLRMMAQDVREETAAAALQALGTMRLPEAARALQTLRPVCPPALRPQAERLLRKLQFAGVAVGPLPLPDPEWRSLVSPVDGLGQQSVWFIQEDGPTGLARFLNILLSDRAGAVEAAGYEQVSAAGLPPRRTLGHMHDIVLADGSGAMLMLEATFDLGRRLVLEALAHNRKTQIPVAGVLRLLSPWLWGYAGAGSLAAQILPQLGDEADDLAGGSDRLVVHPAFNAWTVQAETTLLAAEEAVRHPDRDPEVWVQRLAAEVLADPHVARVFSRRLVAMSEWLMLAGDGEGSRLALAAAQALSESPRDARFVQALIRRDLELVLHSLDQQAAPGAGAEQLVGGV